MLATPSLSQLRAHLSALLPSKHGQPLPEVPAEVVVAQDDPATLAEALEILSDSAGGTATAPEVRSGAGTLSTRLPRR